MASRSLDEQAGGEVTVRRVAVKSPGEARSPAGGTVPTPQRAELTIRGSYFPQVVRLTAGVSTVLSIDRQEGSWCSEAFQIPALGIDVELPCFERTEVVLPALAAGRYDFTCGMQMLHGALDVAEHRPAGSSANLDRPVNGPSSPPEMMTESRRPC